MNVLPIIFIAVGLAMDAFAVSIAGGVINKSRKHLNALKFGLSFGLFQMFMPILGWSLGISLARFVQAFDHWIAFGLLVIIGIKMIVEGIEIETIEKKETAVTFPVLLGLSVATSIDALAVGLTFAFLDVPVVVPALVIGVITFVLSYLGFLVGNKFGHIFEKKIEIAGGLVLIGMGVKILLEHLLWQ